MALQLFGFHGHPHNFAVTKADLPLEDCVFFLDFSRPLEKVRWFGVVNKWLGITIGLLVPVVYQSEQSGGFVIGVNRGEPYFSDIQKLWRKHYRSTRTLVASSFGELGELEVIAQFGKHFPEGG